MSASPWTSAPVELERRPQWWWLTVRALGAATTLAVGAVHLQQYVKLYSSVPTIGPLFVLNFAGATVIGLALLAPIERLAGPFGGAAVALLAAGGIVLAATSFVFLAVAERTTLFGFTEPGYDPTAIAAARQRDRCSGAARRVPARPPRRPRPHPPFVIGDPHMKRLLILGAALAAALTLAACGGGSSSTSTTSGTNDTVSVKTIGGVGRVLVDSHGMALYSSNVEANGKPACTGACNSFWKPLTLASGKPSVAAGAGKVSIVTRSDGKRQVAVDGKPLYTFVQDSPGEVNGNGFSDMFSGRRFTWTAALASGKSAASGSSGHGNSGRGAYSTGGGY